VIDVLELPFDQYQRYRLVSELVEDLRPEGRRLSILDVGGRTALLRAFLPDDAITLVDLEPSAEKALVLGDGSALPFKDRSFDLVFAFDTLEHVPVPRRGAFVAECARVAQRYVVLAGPYQAPEVEEAERILQQFLRDKLGVEHRYLEEHRHHGLPVRAEVEQALRDLGAEVGSFGHGNVDRWLALICLSMYMDYRPELRGVATRFQRFYNARLYDSDHAPPVYRHAIVAAFQGASLPELERLRRPAQAPPGATRRIEELAFELAGFERAQGALFEEKKKLEQGIAELRADLAGHAHALADALERKNEQATVIATLEADLASHRASIAEHERRLEELARDSAAERETLGRDLDAHKRVVAELERDLGSHRAVLEEVRALSRGYEGENQRLVEHVRRSHAEFDAVRATLEREIGSLREFQGGLERELLALRERDAAQTARLEGLELVLGDLERDRAERQQLVAALERDLELHQRAVRDLEAEVHARGRDVAALENAVAAERDARAGVEQDLARHREVLAAREADLAQHREVVRTLSADLEGHRGVVRDLGAQAAELRAGLEAMTHARNEAEQALADARAQIDRARADLSAQHAKLELYREHLASRWKGFKRAFGPRRPLP
jgi:DNA repair exonuclease SbcCD ATPase subunit